MAETTGSLGTRVECMWDLWPHRILICFACHKGRHLPLRLLQLSDLLCGQIGPFLLSAVTHNRVWLHRFGYLGPLLYTRAKSWSSFSMEDRSPPDCPQWHGGLAMETCPRTPGSFLCFLCQWGRQSGRSVLLCYFRH